jgi:peptidoglycan/LPS O-acetylase OafA/YrhL
MLTEKKRNVGLDLMRAIAILFVLIHHWKHHLEHLIPRQIYLVHFFGFYGVEMFFVLSGFLIGNILIKHYLNDEFTFGVIKNFWMRRWFRTLPLYYVVLVFNIILVAAPFWKFWKYLFFVQNFTYPTFNFFRESWSLCIEEWFYLSFPVFLYIINKLFKKKLTKPKILLITIISYILLFTAIRSFIAIHKNPFWNGGIRAVMLYRLDSIAYGVLGAYCFNLYKTFFEKMRVKLFIIGISLFAISLIYFQNYIAYNYYFEKGDTPFFAKSLYFGVVSFSFLCLIPFLNQVNIKNTLVRNSVAFTSKVSYSAYLINLYFVFFLNDAMVDRTWSQVFLILFVFIALTLLVSFFTYTYIEKPFLKLRDKIAKDKYTAI